MSTKSLLFLVTLLFLTLSCNKKESKNKIVIATSANMQFAMKELVKNFKQTHQINCEVVVASSGKLTAQIKEGAPYDVFVSANLKYPNEIYNLGLSSKPPKIYAYGKLVLWSANKAIKPSLSILKNNDIEHIALANPKTAPYGFAATEVLKNLHIYNSIKDKLVFGENISQTNQFISLQTVDVGFTAMSVVLSPQLKNTGNWIEIETQNYTPIKQGVVVVNQKGKINSLALNFYNYLFSDNAKKILTQFGYDVK